MIPVEGLTAIWYGVGGSGNYAEGPGRLVCTIVGFEHVVSGIAPSDYGRDENSIELRAVAIPMERGAPFSAPASEFKVTEDIMRKP